MSESTNDRSPRDRQVDGLITEFELAAEQGRPLDPEEFLKQHAEYAAELRKYFERAQTEAKLKDWLETILTSKPLADPLEETAIEQTWPSQKAMNDEQIKKMADGLAQLSEDERTAIILKHFEARSLAEISKHMGLAISAIAALIKRGHKKLRSHIQTDIE